MLRWLLITIREYFATSFDLDQRTTSLCLITVISVVIFEAVQRKFMVWEMLDILSQRSG